MGGVLWLHLHLELHLLLSWLWLLWGRWPKRRLVWPWLPLHSGPARCTARSTSSLAMPLSPNDFVRGLYGKNVTVKLNSGVLYKGKLTALDGSMNIVMEGTLEVLPNGDQSESYGDAFIRGNNVLYITPQEESP